MGLWAQCRSLLGSVLRRQRVEREMESELQFHLAGRMEDLVRSGLPWEQAARQARIEIGSAELIKDECRQALGLRLFDEVSQDLRYALRMLLKNPGFATVAILTLALGIGSNATIFSIVNGILLRPPPFREPSRLVAVLDSRPAQGVDWVYDSPKRYEEWLRRNIVFEQLAAAENCYFKIERDGVPQLLQGGCASASFFPMLGVQPILGRIFTAEEDRPGGARGAVLSYTSWQNYFGGSPAAIGRTIRRTANDAEFTVIGVLPPSFKFATDDFGLWAPLNTDPNYRFSDERSLLVFGRLKPHVTLQQAQSVMNGVASQLADEFPATGAGWHITVRPLQSFYANVRNIELTLWVLFAAVGVLLLIACANIASLLLARANVRSREISVRLAIGAGPGRVIRQLVTESMLLGLLGGVAGFLLARLTFNTLITVMPYIPSFRSNAIRVDYQVLAFSIGFALLSSVAFGLAPAIRASRQDLNGSLREGGRSLHGNRADRGARALITACQIALAVVLVSSAGLLMESFRNLVTQELGFNPSRVLTARLCCLDETHYRTEKEAAAFYTRLFDRLRSVPSIQLASGSSDLPLRRFQGTGSPYEIRGKPALEPREERTADFFYVEPRYFDTLQIPVVRGRAFTNHDTVDLAPVALINESLVRRVWPGEDPIGQEIRMSADRGMPWRRIIGIVADTRHRGFGTAPQPAIYYSYYQSLGRYVYFLIRTRQDPVSQADQIRKAIGSVTGTLPLDKVETLDQQMADSVSVQRFSMVLVMLFASLALILGAVGVYGVTSCTVSQRTQEIGIRMALGASRWAVLGMFLRETMAIAVIGLASGLAATLGLARFLQNLLYNVRGNDAAILGWAVGFLALVAGIACAVPTLRATRIDVVSALRCD
jgi:putative ABC transport system permease protein